MVKSHPSKELSHGFVAEADAFDQSRWSLVLQEFADANVYQTWPYNVARSGRAKVSHIVLKHRGRAVAVAQARLAGLPNCRMGIAYFRWGPLWKPQSGELEVETFRQVVRAIRNEYAIRRGLIVRLVPALCVEDGEQFSAILEEEGFVQNRRINPYRTILMNIQPSLKDLESGFHRKWRNHLNGARKQQFKIIEGEDDALFAKFEPIYTEMHRRKQFVSDTQIAHFQNAQRTLTEHEKLRVFLCRVDDEFCAGAICSAMGDTGLYIFGATSNRGLKNNGSYLLQWRILEWLKQRGCQWYNLNGINPVTNPSTFEFKTRLAGKHGRDVHFVGHFDAYPHAAAELVVRGGERLRSKIKKLRAGTPIKPAAPATQESEINPPPREEARP